MKFSFFKSKAYLVSALGLIILLVYANWQIYKKSNNKDLDLLKKEALEEQMENQNLAHLKEYLATDVYLERQVREKFKMQKQGEKVMMIEENKLIIKEQNSLRENLPNILKWWYYLFSSLRR